MTYQRVALSELPGLKGQQESGDERGYRWKTPEVAPSRPTDNGEKQDKEPQNEAHKQCH